MTKKAKLMGILNCTPDSFYDGGNYFSAAKAIEHGIQLAKEGADIIDIGGESARPGALNVDAEEEMRRVLPVVSELRKSLKIPLSIDTMKPIVALRALESGATMINDICGFANPEMQRIAASANVPICVMHMQGNPKTMQVSPDYPEGVVHTLMRWFEKRLDLLLAQGIRVENIILDPGIGFGKTVEQNCAILKEIPRLKSLGFPVLLGTSRKSFLSKILNKSPKELLSTTLAVNTMSLLWGVDIIRVHDVEQHRGVIDLLFYLKKNGFVPGNLNEF